MFKLDNKTLETCVRTCVPVAARLPRLLCALRQDRHSETYPNRISRAHLLLIIVAIAHHATSVLLPVLLIALSTTVWVVGILQLRRTLRVWGLVDLVMAILSALIFVPDIFGPTTMLIALMVVAAELGVVSWLGLRNEAQMVKD